MEKKCRNGRLGLIILTATFFQQAEAQNRIPVVPYPQEVTFGKDWFSPSGSSLSLRTAGLEGNTLKIIEEQLSAAISDRYQMELAAGDDKSPDIWVGLPSEDNRLLELARRKGMVPGSDLGEEGYVLKIEKKNIYIVANSAAGAFYGIQSLKQMLRGYSDPLQLPVLTIHDWPSIDFRCVMDDISRGPIPTNK